MALLKRIMKVVTMEIVIEKQERIENKKESTHTQAMKEILEREKIQAKIK